MDDMVGTPGRPGKEEEVKMNRQRTNNGGFSLIEILVALTILAIGLLAVVKLQVAAIRSLSFSRHLTTATQLGEQQMEWLRSLPFDPILPNTPPKDSAGSNITVGGSSNSVFLDDSVNQTQASFLDGIPGSWHSHPDNPLNALGEQATRGEMKYFVRWRVNRGPISPTGNFTFPGLEQMHIELEVIWWENSQNAPANPTHFQISGWTETTFRNTDAHRIRLESVRQQDI